MNNARKVVYNLFFYCIYLFLSQSRRAETHLIGPTVAYTARPENPIRLFDIYGLSQKCSQWSIPIFEMSIIRMIPNRSTRSGGPKFRLRNTNVFLTQYGYELGW